jgi:predicted dehydrogenase
MMRISVGVIGLGEIGQAHVDAYAGLPNVDVVGVFDVDQALAASTATRLGTRFSARIRSSG